MGELNIQVKVLKNAAPVLFTWWNREVDSAEGYLVTCDCQNWGLMEEVHLPGNKEIWERGRRHGKTDNESITKGMAVNLCKALEQAEIVSIHMGVQYESVLETKSHCGSQNSREIHDDIGDTPEGGRSQNVSEGSNSSMIDIENSRKRKLIENNKSVGKRGKTMKEMEKVTADEEDNKQRCVMNSQTESLKLPQRESALGMNVEKESGIGLNESSATVNLNYSQGTNLELMKYGSENGSLNHKNDSVQLLNTLANSGAAEAMIRDGKDSELYHTHDVESLTAVKMLSSEKVQTTEVGGGKGICSDTVVVVSDEKDISEVDSLFRVLKGIMDGEIPQEETNEASNCDLEEPSALAPQETSMTYEKQQRILYLKKLHEKPKNKAVEKTICEICGAISNTLTIKKHLATCHFQGKRERNYTCEVCGQKFFRCENLKRHKRLHSDPAFHCQRCNRSFRQAYQLKAHQKAHMGCKQPGRLRKPNRSGISKEIIKAKGFSNFVLCIKCGLKMDKDCIGKHLEAKHGIKPPSFKCSHCEKELSNLSSLKIHKLRHTELTYKCSFCDMTLDSNKDRLRHEKIHSEDISRSGKLVFKCGYCTKEYSRQTDRLRHEMTHVDKTINSSHVRSMEEDIPLLVNCGICGQTLRQQSMRNHLLSHDHKSWTCEICKKTFTYSYRYQHSKLHQEDKPHACQVCPAKFYSKSALVVHVRKHTKEKPIPCRYCDKMFSRHGARNNHERLHTGERPYKCGLCQKAWRDRPTYMQHMRKHHPGVPMMKWRKPNRQDHNSVSVDPVLENVPSMESNHSDNSPLGVVSFEYGTSSSSDQI